MRAVRLALGVCVAAIVVACGGSDLRPKLFSSEWSDDNGRSISDVRTKLRDAPFPHGADVVVAVAASGDRLIGVPMVNGSKWSFKHVLDSRPQIAGALVIGSGGGEVFALDGTTGKQIWSRPTGGLPVRGAGDDGALTAITLGKAESAGSVLLVIARDGTVKRQVETDKVLGVPAMLGGYAFVPWSNQYISAYDTVTGDEIGRVTLREKVSRAWTESGALYFGEVGIFRFDDHIKDASKNGASHITIPQRELPGTPRLLVPGTERVPVAAGAFDQARLYARPAGGANGPYGVDTSHFYGTYYSLVMGFDSNSGKLTWVHTNKADVIGGEAVPYGLVTCDEDGKIITMAANNGATLAELAIGEPIKSCVVMLDSYKADNKSVPAGTLTEQITTAVSNREATLATAQRLLLRELATLPDEDATKTLIDLTNDPHTPPIVHTDARVAIAGRRTGAKYMRQALAKHYDYLSDVLVSPAVGPMADALAAMKEPDSAAPLAYYLSDPNVTEDDVKRTAAALLTLATPAELPALKRFFTLYRAGSETEDMALATTSVAQTLLRLDPPQARLLIGDAVADPLTSAGLKPKLEAILAADQSAPDGAADGGAPPTKSGGGAPTAKDAGAPKK